MSKKINGRFYFKQTTNGNLIGEYSNQGSDIWTESADKIIGKGKYIGEYKSTWQEKGVPHIADLKISFRDGSNERIFCLEWRGNNNNFDGEGMLCDDILIGNYWSV